MATLDPSPMVVDLSPLWETFANWPPPFADPPTFLRDYLPSVLGVQIPDVHVCPDHDTPADFMRLAIDPNVTTALAVGPRGGMKSLQAAIAAWCHCRKYPRFPAEIIAGSRDQAAQCYEHTLAFWDRLGGRLAAQHLQGDALRALTRLRNGSGYSILSSSQTHARGSHVPLLIVDEVDEIKPAILQAILGIRSDLEVRGLTGQKVAVERRGKILYLSTINRAGGPVEGLMNDRHKSNLKLVLWCWKETTETCRDRTCSTCPLHVENPDGEPWCGGEMKQEGLEGFMTIDHVIDYFNDATDETFHSEMASNLRQLRGAVLKRQHIERALADVSHDKKMATTWLGLDCGYTDETSVAVFQWDGKLDLRIVAEYNWTEKDDQESADAIDAIGKRHGLKEGNRLLYGGADDPGMHKTLRREEKGRGWRTVKVAESKWKDACIDRLRVWLSGRGGRRTRINRNLTHLHGALVQWHYAPDAQEERIVKKDDHPCDAVANGMKHLTREEHLKGAAMERQKRAAAGPDVVGIGNLGGGG